MTKDGWRKYYDITQFKDKDTSFSVIYDDHRHEDYHQLVFWN